MSIIFILASLYYLFLRLFRGKESRKALARYEGATYAKRQRRYEHKNRAGRYDAGRAKYRQARSIDLDEAIGAWEDAG